MERPDLDFVTNFRARELRVGKRRDVKVTYYGEPDHETRVRVERENLPEEVEEGASYRDVGIRWIVQQRIVHPSDEAGAEEAEE